MNINSSTRYFMKIEDIRKLSENLSFYRIKEADEVPQDDDDEKQEEATQKAEEQIESENSSMEEENPVEEKQEKVKTNITSADDNFKPSSLQNPNTENSTGLQKDSNLVAPERIAPKEGECKIKFEKGEFSVGKMSPAVESKAKVMNNTILPLIEKAFIEGTGNSGTYRRLECNAVETNGKIDMDLVYHIDSFIGNDIDEASVINDQNYIYNTIKVVPGINIRNIKIDTTTGNINIGISL